MTVHLIKLSVGPANLGELEAWQKQRRQDLQAQGKKPELMHVTRQTPKRADEVLNGGSIYWVIGGWIVARQKLLELRPLTQEGTSYCGLVLDRKMVKVRNQQRRPFQGWRYLEPEDAPPDLARGETSDADMPEDMRRELRALGLI